MWRDLMRAINRRDWDTSRTFFVEDYRAVDHKPIGWEPIEGPDGIVRLLRSSFSGVEDARLTSEIIAVEDGLFARAMTMTGHAPRGGPVRARRAGPRGGPRRPDRARRALRRRATARRCSRGSRSCADDRDGVQVAPGVDPGHPMVAVWRAQVELVRRRDYAALRALFAEGYRGVDHRTVGWEELEGPDALVELMRTTTGRGDGEMSGEVLAVADGLSLRAQRFAGHDAHGGAFEAVFHAITVVRDGLIVREEFFAPEAPRGGAGAVRRAGPYDPPRGRASTPLTRWWSSRASGPRRRTAGTGRGSAPCSRRTTRASTIGVSPGSRSTAATAPCDSSAPATAASRPRA